MDNPIRLVKRWTARAAALLCLVALGPAAARPRNVILIIGDGMGVGAVSAARQAAAGGLLLDSMPVTGLVTTRSHDRLVTDSAAAGTALATGCKTDNGFIAVDPAGRVLPTILELALSLGKSGGVVTTDHVTSATPAAFYAHLDNRGRQEEIAVLLAGSKLTVAMGSGRRYFGVPGSGRLRGDGRDVAAEAARNGFEVVLDAAAMEASRAPRLLGLFLLDGSGPSLAAMLARGAALLSRNPRGFFLMAESCLIDKGGHENDIERSLRGMRDLEEALRVALDFSRKDGRTLVLVTADHETGGLAVLDPGAAHPRFTPGWLTPEHTGNMVPLWARGPGAEKFSGTLDNTEIPRLIASLWGKRLEECGSGR